jgi:hypothetical protein
MALPCWKDSPISQMFITISAATLYLFAGTIAFHALENIPYVDALYWSLSLNWQTGTRI